jgi:hypothetical protein
MSNDTTTPERCVAALYDVISGAPDTPRDWARFRSLCRPNARFLLVRAHPDGTPLTAEWDVEGFVAEGTKRFADAGLWEREIARRVTRFGRVAHVFSTYETRLRAPDAPIAARGINSIQLVEEGGVWTIAQLIWDVERAGNELPEEYLPRGNRPA